MPNQQLYSKLSPSEKHRLKYFIRDNPDNDTGIGWKKPTWLSIRKADSCLFSRRNGHTGKIVLGYSICLRLFGKTII